MRPYVEPLVCKPHDILRLDTECGKELTEAADSHFSFPRAGETKISPLRQAYSIVDQGAQ